VVGSVTNDRAYSDCEIAVEGGYKSTFGVRDEYEDAPKRVDRVKATGIRVGKRKSIFFQFLAMLHKYAGIHGYHIELIMNDLVT